MGRTCRPTARAAATAWSFEPYPKSAPRACRRDAWPETAARPAAISISIRAQYLDDYGIEYGILGPLGITGQSEMNLDLQPPSRLP